MPVNLAPSPRKNPSLPLQKKNVCSFWVSFIYRCGFVTVSRLVDYLMLFLLIFCLMEFFTFLWKTYFVEKVFFFFFWTKNENPFVGITYVFARKVIFVMRPRKRFDLYFFSKVQIFKWPLRLGHGESLVFCHFSTKLRLYPEEDEFAINFKFWEANWLKIINNYILGFPIAKRSNVTFGYL